MRNNAWLEERLEAIWQGHFADIERQNKVIIRFGRWAKYQFGVISYDRHTNVSTIRINSMFTDESISQDVVDHTIAHELVHYSHGFSSPLKRKHRYPHHGGIVNKELQQRGLGYLITAYKVWLKAYRKTLAAHR